MSDRYSFTVWAGCSLLKELLVVLLSQQSTWELGLLALCKLKFNMSMHLPMLKWPPARLQHCLSLSCVVAAFHA
jgi:hypothetical protein